MDMGTDMWKIEKKKQAAEVVPQTGAGSRGGSNFMPGIKVSPDQHPG